MCNAPGGSRAPAGGPGGFYTAISSFSFLASSCIQLLAPVVRQLLEILLRLLQIVLRDLEAFSFFLNASMASRRMLRMATLPFSAYL